MYLLAPILLSGLIGANVQSLVEEALQVEKENVFMRVSIFFQRLTVWNPWLNIYLVIGTHARNIQSGHLGLNVLNHVGVA